MAAPTAEEVRRQLCYELKWMLGSVVRFEQLTNARGEPTADVDAVAFQDSALMHARNLIEFAAASSDPKASKVQWALSDILGTHRRKVPNNLSRFLDDWVVHLGALRARDGKWPKDLDGIVIDAADDARLSKVTAVVLKLLKPKHRTTTLETEAGTAYVELLDRAYEYFEQRTPEAFDRLTCDGRPMPAP